VQHDTGPYGIPDAHVTAQGRAAVDQTVGGWTRALHSELDRQAGLDDRRGDPEYRYTRNDVLAAKASVERSFRSADAPDPRSILLAPILVTLGSVGSSVMPHFLHSPWQWVLFLVLVLTGVLGLVLTWVNGTRAKRGSPPAPDRVRAPSARLDG
jgi:hypothetical protein